MGGIITIIIAGMTAIIEIDIKKIIALSTLRQLGIMMLILGSGNPILSFFHLISHAFFKAMLFMCAGIIIHNIKDYQDIRKMGIGLNFIPIILSILIILCGTFLTVAYSCRLTYLVGNRVLEAEPTYSINDKDIFIFLGIVFLLP